MDLSNPIDNPYACCYFPPLSMNSAPPNLDPEASRLSPPPRWQDYLPMTLATLFWAMPTLFIRYIRRETADQFPPEAFNVYRYASGAIFALALVAFWKPHDFAAVLRKLWVPALLAFFLAVFQAVWVPGVCLVSAPYSTLMGRSSILFNLLFVFILIKDERPLIRSRRFLVASAFCLAAVAGIALADPAFSLHGPAGNHDYIRGTLLLLVAALLWSFYTIAIRRLAPRLPAAATFSVTAVLCTLFLIPLSLRNGSLGFIASPACTGKVILALVLSGILCIASTQMLFYTSLKRIGVVRTSLISLLTPFLTGVMSVITLGEVLTPLQWILGATLLGGLAFIIVSHPRPPRLAP